MKNLKIADRVKFLSTAPKFANYSAIVDNIIKFGGQYSAEYIFEIDGGAYIAIDELELPLYIESITNDIHSIGIKSPYELRGIDLLDFNEIEETKELSCPHPKNKRKIVFMTYSNFMYCEACKKDIGEAK